MLARFFYENNADYLEFISSIEQKNKLDSSCNFFYSPYLKSVLNEKSSLITYILNDFKVYFVTDPIRSRNEKYLNNRSKRMHKLFLLFLFNIYITYYNKYILILCNKVISISFISIIIFIVLCFLAQRITKFSDEQDCWLEQSSYKKAFNIILTLYSLVLFYLFIKNKIILNPSEVIISVDNFFTITETFTLNEKSYYLKKYLYQRCSDTFDKEYIDKLILKEKHLISIKMNLMDIKTLAYNIYKSLQK